MSSCQNCKAVIVTLKTQLYQLQKETQLLQIENQRLINKVNEEDYDCDYWKQKYLQKKQENDRIQSNIKKKQNQQSSFSTLQTRMRAFTPEVSVQQIVTARTIRKENIHDKSVRKMSELMKAIVLQKASETIKPYKKLSARRQSKRQPLLRIDDRPNFIF